ncbi:endonuclease/exonuclease/phosphatase family protein [Rhizobium jaguaris]|uniref:Endonuclease/exonuclease/phosphatase domain-containing protein n=1 Tax=Rhizobium jaguaris TaxID=1312183 RepID=A0A387G002_9HYPH|nr:endonuclease/exonuclease/phosphatase family protein [Rhizobium jaguaris]AYG61704.1 hypothetical protein CCGE525_22720 [Rhizobium jaguaris]
MLPAPCNIRYGIGKDDHYDLGRTLDEVSHADIVALQEIDVGWSRTDFHGQVEMIKQRFPGYAVAWGPNIDTMSSRGATERRQHGNAIVSRYCPILSCRLALLWLPPVLQEVSDLLCV